MLLSKRQSGAAVGAMLDRSGRKLGVCGHRESRTRRSV